MNAEEQLKQTMSAMHLSDGCRERIMKSAGENAVLRSKAALNEDGKSRFSRFTSVTFRRIASVTAGAFLVLVICIVGIVSISSKKSAKDEAMSPQGIKGTGWEEIHSDGEVPTESAKPAIWDAHPDAKDTLRNGGKTELNSPRLLFNLKSDNNAEAITDWDAYGEASQSAEKQEELQKLLQATEDAAAAYSDSDPFTVTEIYSGRVEGREVYQVRGFWQTDKEEWPTEFTFIRAENGEFQPFEEE